MNLTVVYLTNLSISTIQVHSDVSGRTVEYPMPPSGVSSVLLHLEEGMNTIEIFSQLDGMYTIKAERFYRDVELIQLYAYEFDTVSSLALAQQQSVRRSPYVFHPAWRSGVFRGYNLTLPYRWTHVSALVSYNSSQLIELRYLGTAIPRAFLIDNRPVGALGTNLSAVVGLNTTLNTLLLSSKADGNYRFELTRLPPDILNVTVRLLDVYAVVHSDVAAWFGPLPWGYGQVGPYNLTVPFTFQNVSFNVSFRTPGSIRLDSTQLGGAAAGVLLITGNDSPFLQLRVGWNQLHVASTQDGNVTYNIFRQPPDLLSIHLFGVYQDVDGTKAWLPALPSPTFVSGSFLPLHISLPWQQSAVSISLNFTRSASIVLHNVTVSGTGTVPALYTFDPWTPANQFELAVPMGESVWHLRADFDGTYTIIIARQVLNITYVQLSARNATSGLPVALPLMPAWERGVFNASVATVPYVYDVLSFHLAGRAGSTNGFTLNGVLPFETLPMDVWSRYISMPAAMAALPINTFRLLTETDGLYTFQITRRAQDIISIMPVVASMYDTLAPVWVAVGLSPGYQAHVFQFAATVYFQQDSTVLRVRTRACNTSVFWLSYQGVFMPIDPLWNADLCELTTGVLPLQVGSNHFTLNHSLDGHYGLTIVRRPLSVATLQVWTWLYPGGNVDGGAATLTPTAFVTGRLSPYSTVVPYKVWEVSVLMTYNVAGNIASLNGSGSVAVPNGGQMGNPFALTACAQHILTVNSLNDGIYRFSIWRNVPDLSALVLQLVHSDNSISNLPATAWVPSWTAGVSRESWYTVDYVTYHFSLLPTFGVAGSVLLMGWNSSVAYTLVSGQLSPRIPLLVGLNFFELSSSQDGNYTLVLQRQAISTNDIDFFVVWADETRPPATQLQIDLTATVPAFARNGFQLNTYNSPGYVFGWTLPFQRRNCSFTYWAFAPPRHNTVQMLAWMGASSSQYTLISGVRFQPSILLRTVSESGQTGNTFLVVVPADGNYTFSISVWDPVVDALRLRWTNSTSCTHVEPPTAPVYTKGSFPVHHLTVPFVYTELRIQATFTAGALSFVLNGGAAPNLISGSDSAIVPILLLPSVNTLTFTNERDGFYTFVVRRQVPDVLGLSFQYWNDQSQLSTRLTMTPPTFSPYVFRYSITVAFQILETSFTFTSTSGATLRASCNVTQLTASSGTPVPRIRLFTGSANLTLFSPNDGNYIFTIYRPGLDTIVAGLWTADGPATPGALSSLMLDRSFVTGDLGPYGASVPYRTMWASVQASYLALANPVGVNPLTSSNNAAQIRVLVNNTASAPFRLYVGLNRVVLDSYSDGFYTFDVWRAAADVRSPLFNFLSADSVAQSSINEAQLVPAWQVDHFDYELCVPFVQPKVQLSILYTIPSSVTWLATGLTATAPLSSATPAPSSFLDIPVGVTSWVVSSTHDGSYTFAVRRDAPNVTTINIRTMFIDRTTSITPPGAPSIVSVLAPAVTAATSPVWLPALFTPYTIVDVPSKVHQLTFAVIYSFTGTGSVLLRALPGGPEVALISNTLSPVQPLALGQTTTFLLQARRDGNYTFQIFRRPYDVQGIAMEWYSRAGTGPLALTDSPIPLSLTFVPGTFEYLVTVPYIFQQVRFTSSFLLADSVTGRWNGGAASGETSGLPTVPHSLVAPTTASSVANLYTLESSEDDEYRVDVWRKPADVTAFVFHSLTAVGAATPVPFTSAFVRGTTAYAISLPFVAKSFRVTLTWLTTPLKLPAVYDGMQLASALSSGVASADIPVGGTGTHSLTVVSTLDGNYTVSIVSRPPQIQTLVLREWWGQPSESFSVRNFAFDPFDSATATYGVVPALTVPYKTTGMSVLSTFITTHALNIQNKWNNVAQAQLFTTTESSKRTLLIGPNELVLTSTEDGVYSFHVTRTPQEVSAPTFDYLSTDGVAVTRVLGPDLNPAWGTDIFNYQVRHLPFATAGVKMALTFATSVTLVNPLDNSVVTLASATLHPAASVIALPLGWTRFTAISDADGNVSTRMAHAR